MKQHILAHDFRKGQFIVCGPQSEDRTSEHLGDRDIG